MKDAFLRWLGLVAIVTLFVVTVLLIAATDDAYGQAASTPANSAKIADAGPHLTPADETAALALYNKAVLSQAAFQRDLAAWTDWQKKTAAERGFPAGTTFNVALGACDPDPKGGVHCRQTVSVVAPPAAQEKKP